MYYYVDVTVIIAFRSGRACSFHEYTLITKANMLSLMSDVHIAGCYFWKAINVMASENLDMVAWFISGSLIGSGLPTLHGFPGSMLTVNQ